MATWIVFALLGVIAVAVVGYPFLKARRSGATAEPAAPADTDAPPAAPRRVISPRVWIGGGVAAVLAASAGLYFGTSPKATETVVAPAAMGAKPAAAGALPDVDTMIDRLAKRLQASPKDPEGWRMLGWSYFATQHYPESVKAYARAVEQSPKNAAFLSAYGEAQMKASGDKITPEAEASFRKSLAIDPKDGRALIYVARLKGQAGDAHGAIETLFGILKTTPADSALRPTVLEAIKKVSADSGIDVSSRLPAAPPPSASPSSATSGPVPGPTAADVAAAQTMAPQDQKAMIEGMVSKLETRLAASPRDADGWIMLIRSRKQLGQPDKAVRALQDSQAVFKDDAAARARITAAAHDLGVG